ASAASRRARGRRARGGSGAGAGGAGGGRARGAWGAGGGGGGARARAVTTPLGRGPGLLVLVDPSRTAPAEAATVARAARAAGAAGILIGSSFDGTQDTELVARAIRQAAAGLPVALFPGSALQLTKEVDLKIGRAHV